MTVVAGAAMVAPLLSMAPVADELAAMTEAYHRTIEQELLERIRAGVWEQLSNTNYQTAIAATQHRSSLWACPPVDCKVMSGEDFQQFATRTTMMLEEKYGKA